MKPPTRTSRIPRKTLAATLTSAFFFLSALVLLIASSLQLFASYQAQQKAIFAEQYYLGQDAASTVSSFIQERFSVLETAVRLASPVEQSLAEQQVILDSLLGAQPSFRQLALLNAQNQQLCKASRLSLAASEHLLERLSDAALTQSHKGQRSISPVFVDTLSSEPMLLMAVPAMGIFGDFQGTLVAEVNLKFMWDLVDQLEVGKTGQAYVVDHEGDLIAFEDMSRVLKGENVAYLEEVGEFVQAVAGNTPTTSDDDPTPISNYVGISGKYVVGTYVPLGTPDWAVLVEVPWQEAYEKVIWNAGWSTAITLGMAALSGLLGMLMARRLAVPLITLTETAARITDGDLELQAVVDGPHEVMQLAATFNTMTTRLRQTLEGLEQRVEQRTADLKRANQELEDARRTAEEASELKTRFLANMSHELRTPLNAILNFTRFLSKDRYGGLSERQIELQQRILANADHLLGLINDILDLSKIEAGHIEIAYEQVDLAPLLNGVMSTAVGLTKDKGLGLELDLAESLPPVWIDKTRIRQVLLNLLSNAAKFTPQGTITVRVTRHDELFVCLAVQDTGIGIAPEHQSLVFEEFRQVQSDLTREYQGTGLGLPISKRLVEMHGGRMWLESTPGQGSTFFFTLPCQAPSPANDERPTIVVVDDNPAAQDIIRRCLVEQGYTIHSVLDSRQAVETIHTVQPKLVILDVMMPHLDGWEVITQLKSQMSTAAIPVLICSVVNQQALGIALGASDYLVKPIHEHDLISHVQRLIRAAGTVLVVDDNADARQIIRDVLTLHNYRVVEAADGATGLELLASTLVDLLVLDLMMPGMDGFEMLERLRAQPAYAALPVLILTAHRLTAAEQQWLQERTQFCLQKSRFSVEEFTSYVIQLLEKSMAV